MANNPSDDTENMDIKILKKISKEFDYPIRNRRELAENLDKASMDIANHILKGKIDKIDPNFVKKIVPAYYFPISDNEDFIDKALELLRDRGLRAMSGPLGDEWRPDPDEHRTEGFC